MTEERIQQLRERGYRLTPQRAAVLEAVEALGHATPDQVHEAVKERGVNLSTVYRTLELLDEVGLIHHAHLSDRAPTYHSTRGHEHVHLVCRSCKKVISLGAEEVAAALGDLVGQQGFVPDWGHLSVFGTCAECAE